MSYLILRKNPDNTWHLVADLQPIDYDDIFHLLVTEETIKVKIPLVQGGHIIIKMKALVCETNAFVLERTYKESV